MDIYFLRNSLTIASVRVFLLSSYKTYDFNLKWVKRKSNAARFINGDGSSRQVIIALITKVLWLGKLF
jgi:hypothetical protein